MRIIDKTGPLANPADRDHCIQYMVAVPLIFGRLTAADYEDEVAADPRIDRLRELMQVRENADFTAGLLRSGAPLHRQRRTGVLQGRQRDAARAGGLPGRPPPPARRGPAAAGRQVRSGGAARIIRPRQAARVVALFADPARLAALTVNEFMAELVSNGR